MAVSLSGRPESRHLVIFLKAPRLGRVKRRLARDVGAVEAWTFYRRTTETVIRRLSGDSRWRTRLVITPDRSLTDGYRWPAALPRVGQGAGDLGARMYRALSQPPPGPVVLIGGDIPEIMPRDIADAFRVLGSRDVVFGPACDGGFWLVGARRTPRSPRMFDRVRWSHPETLSDAVATLDPRVGVGYARSLADVDDGAALARWREARSA